MSQAVANDSTNNCRRLALSAASAIKALESLSEIVAAEARAADPIFGVIARYKEAEQNYAKFAGIPGAEDLGGFELAEKEFGTATDALVAAVPASLAGLKAALGYSAHENSLKEFLPRFLESLARSPVLDG